MAFLVAGFTFLVIAGIVLLATLFLGGRRPQQDVIRRLEAIAKAERRGSTSAELQLIRDELLSGVPAINRLLLQLSWAARLRQFVGQAGWKIKPARLVLFSAVAGMSVYLIVLRFYLSLLLALGAGAAAAFVPFGVMLFARLRRLRAFERSFPEAIDLLVRALQAGHAFTTGLEIIGQELSEPLAGEFRIVFEEQKFGLPLKDALLNLAERIPLIDVRFFVTTILVQKETGGNLAEVLEKLSQVIRERYKIYGEVRIRTAQGRLTAAILIGLPPLMMVLLETTNPDYIRPLFHDPWGVYGLTVVAILQVIGSVILWKIVRIEV